MERRILDKDDNIVIDTLKTQECADCIKKHSQNGYAQIECNLDKLYKRIAYHTGKDGTLFLCSSNSKTTKLFKDEFLSLIPCIQSYVDISNDIKASISAEAFQRSDRVIHNLKTINGHAIQELENLVPQMDIGSNKNVENVANVIKSHPKEAALTFFRMAKFQRAMKAEFTVYDKLLRGDEILLQKQKHKVPDIIMSVLHPFFADFHEKEVYVRVDTTEAKALLDFETFYVALYHVIENATKYVKPQTQISITFNVENNRFIINISMKSLLIEENEENDIFNEGYSGTWAKKMRQQGKGIGMFRARRLIELNDGFLDVNAGNDISILNGIKYATNTFIISLPMN